MSNAYLCPILQEPQWTDDAQFLAGGLMWFYYAGTTTPLTAYTDPTATTAWPNPIVLDARGEAGGEIWLQSGQYYKIVLEGAPLYGQTHGATISMYDNVSGINDATLSVSGGDWSNFGGTPTFLSSNSFSVSSDQRAIFEVNRRVKATCSAGLQYGTIVSSVYSTVTTVTLRMDAGNDLDSGLTAVQYGIIQTNPSSIPVAVQTGTKTSGSNHEIYIDYDGTNALLDVDNTTFGATWPINISGTAAVQVPSGAVFMWATNTAPSGYLECNGSAISRTTYANLFASIGTTFGVGNGSTTFNLPDMRGYFARGWDNGHGVDPGRTFGSTQTSANLSHTHTDAGHSHNFIAAINSPGAPGTGSVGVIAPAVGSTYSASANIQASGGTESRPINLALMYIIKT